MSWQAELSEIYRELDEEISKLAPKCETRGLCCHFVSYGHVLFVSSLEVDYLLSKAGPPKVPVSKEVCPYLINNLCTVREHRTLGCRVFYCQKDWQEPSQELYERYYSRIKELAVKYRLKWFYAPMVRLLKEGSIGEGYERWAIEDR
jgi:hypothetical protein